MSRVARLVRDRMHEFFSKASSLRTLDRPLERNDGPLAKIGLVASLHSRGGGAYSYKRETLGTFFVTMAQNQLLDFADLPTPDYEAPSSPSSISSGDWPYSEIFDGPESSQPAKKPKKSKKNKKRKKRKALSSGVTYYLHERTVAVLCIRNGKYTLTNGVVTFSDTSLVSLGESVSHSRVSNVVATDPQTLADFRDYTKGQKFHPLKTVRIELMKRAKKTNPSAECFFCRKTNCTVFLATVEGISKLLNYPVDIQRH